MFSEDQVLDLYLHLSKRDAYFAFDVDGTLTPSRESISPELKQFFFDYISMDRVALVTGSDPEKTIEQVGRDFWEACGYSLQCCGNEVYRFGKLVSKSEWTPDSSLMNRLVEVLTDSEYPDELRRGKHFEGRVGMLNFSVVGRNAVGEERTHYAEYDRRTGERNAIARDLRQDFDGIDFVCGGDTGIDIFPKGKDKSQAVQIIGPNLIFMGDRMDEDGNDYSLAVALKRAPAHSCAHSYHVSGPDEVQAILSCYLKKDLLV